MQLQRLVSLRIIWYSRIIMIWFNTFDHLIQFESILWFGFNVRNVEQKDSKRHDWSKTWGSARSRGWEMNFSVETILCCQPHGSNKNKPPWLSFASDDFKPHSWIIEGQGESLLKSGGRWQQPQVPHSLGLWHLAGAVRFSCVCARHFCDSYGGRRFPEMGVPTNHPNLDQLKLKPMLWEHFKKSYDTICIHII